MTMAEAPPEVADRVIQTIKKGETSSLGAVHGFITTVNDTIPEVAGAEGRKKVIDSAFKMTEEFGRGLVRRGSAAGQGEPGCVERSRQDGQELTDTGRARMFG